MVTDIRAPNGLAQKGIVDTRVTQISANERRTQMIDAFLAFDADVQKLPQWVQIWMDSIGVVVLVSVVTLLIGRKSRLLGLYVLVTILASLILMVVMHTQMGMVRLLGLAHIILWSPMVWVLWRQLRNNQPSKIVSFILAILMITCTAALLFDFYDVARWIFGQRAPIV